METNQTGGRCLCGAVRYIVKGEPLWCGHCHCENCRRNTGSVVATYVGFARRNFSVVAGELSRFRSSPGVTRSFCTTCGTPMAFESEKFKGEIQLFIGTLDHPENYEPQFHVFCENRLPWLNIVDANPCYDTVPDDYPVT